MIQDCTYKDTRVCGVQNYTIYIRINFKIELSVTSNGIVIGKYQTLIVLHVFEPRFRQYTEDPWFPSTPFLPTGGVIKKRIFLLNKGRCHAVFRLGCWMTLSKCASDMGTPVSPTNKTDRNNIYEIVESGIKHHKPTHIKLWSPQDYGNSIRTHLNLHNGLINFFTLVVAKYSK
jgi:hypothetical protein